MVTGWSQLRERRAGKENHSLLITLLPKAGESTYRRRPASVAGRSQQIPPKPLNHGHDEVTIIPGIMLYVHMPFRGKVHLTQLHEPLKQRASSNWETRSEIHSMV